MQGRLVVVGLGTTAKVILGVGTIAGGSLAIWKTLQEVVEVSRLGPPAWWVLWRRPLTPHAPPVAVSDLRVTRIFTWNRSRWVPVTSFRYGSDSQLDVSGQPEGRTIVARAEWTRRKASDQWSAAPIFYAGRVIPSKRLERGSP